MSDLSYSNYSKKSFLVQGSKDKYGALLKKVNARWNNKAKPSPGWMVGIEKEAELIDIINSIKKKDQLKSLNITAKSNKDQKKYHRATSDTEKSDTEEEDIEITKSKSRGIEVSKSGIDKSRGIEVSKSGIKGTKSGIEGIEVSKSGIDKSRGKPKFTITSDLLSSSESSSESSEDYKSPIRNKKKLFNKSRYSSITVSSSDDSFSEEFSSPEPPKKFSSRDREKQLKEKIHRLQTEVRNIMKKRR